MRPPSDLPPLTIETVYDDGVDFTETWGDRRHNDIFPAVYRRHRAPHDPAEAEQQIEDLAVVITRLNGQYDQARQDAIGLGLDPTRDRPTKDRLKVIRSARNRYEAVRRAYIHWLAIERGEPQLLPSLGATQYSGKARIELLGSVVLTLLDAYLADLEGEVDPQVLRPQLQLLRQQLAAVFVCNDATAVGERG